MSHELSIYCVQPGRQVERTNPCMRAVTSPAKTCPKITPSPSPRSCPPMCPATPRSPAMRTLDTMPTVRSNLDPVSRNKTEMTFNLLKLIFLHTVIT